VFEAVSTRAASHHRHGSGSLEMANETARSLKTNSVELEKRKAKGREREKEKGDLGSHGSTVYGSCTAKTRGLLAEASFYDCFGCETILVSPRQ